MDVYQGHPFLRDALDRQARAGIDAAALLLIFGVVGAGAEYRQRTLAPALLIARGRARLLVARVFGYGLAGLAMGVVMTIVAFAVGLPPGRGPSLHTHDYAEVMIVQEGTATFTEGATTQEVGAGHIVVIPAGEPHGFTNTGDGPLRQIDVHVADAYATDWLESD